MIIYIDTSKLPDESTRLWAEIILQSYKHNQTPDKTVEEMKQLLRRKEEQQNVVR